MIVDSALYQNGIRVKDSGDISDFVDEVPGHLHNRLIKQLADKLWNSNVSSKDDNLIFLSIYEELVSLEILGESEIASIQEFINVVDTLNVY